MNSRFHEPPSGLIDDESTDLNETDDVLETSLRGAAPASASLSPVLQNISIWSCLLISSCYNLMIRGSQLPDGSYAFNTSSIVFWSIFAKFAFSIVMMGLQTKELYKLNQLVTLKTLAAFAVPAFLFAVDDNLTFFILSYIDNATATTTAQIKIVFTALLFRTLVGRDYSVVQKIALLLLFVGVIGAKSHLFDCVDPNSPQQHFSIDKRFLTGILLVCFSSFISSLADVYTEFIMKKTATEHSIHLQNTQLYVWGLLINFVMMFVRHAETTSVWFAGFGAKQLFLVLSLASMGFLTSVIFKHLSVMTKTFVNCGVMLVTSIGSAVFFDFVPTLPFFCAFVTIVCGVVLYNNENSMRLSAT